MKKFTAIPKLSKVLFFVLLSSTLFAQEPLELLMKIDKGLPPSGLNGSNLGEVISFVGDINNDGFDDWAVGLENAVDYETGKRGKVYIYFGSDEIQNHKTPDVILSGCDKNFPFGRYIEPAGDVNGDGFSDILIDGFGEIYLYYGGKEISSEADERFPLIPNKEWGVFSISTAGDVNNDGFDDLIAGKRGFAYIYFGGTKIDTIPDLRLSEGDEQDWFGFEVSNAGDINNDGFDDVIIGASQFPFGKGKVYAFLGGSEMDTVPDLILNGEYLDSSFGNSLACVGDLNNDGFDDFSVGAYRVNKVYIYFGSASLDTIADVTMFGEEAYGLGDINNDGFDDFNVRNWDYKDDNGQLMPLIHLGGNEMGSIADFILPDIDRVAGAGDCNGDGFSDVLGSNSKNDENGVDAGKISIFKGSYAFDTIPDIFFYGEAANEHFGSLVSGAGDLNNDGYNDFIITSSIEPYTESYGYINVYFGRDVLNTEPDLKIIGESENYNFGESVALAGDVNSDGFSDLIVGRFQPAAVKIYLGGKAMDTIPDIVFQGNESSISFGNNVSSAGDFNNDGFDDILIGEYLNSANGTQSGRTYLYYGGISMDTVPDLIFEGEAKFILFGEKNVCAGDLNNDGYSDIVISAPGYDLENTNTRVGRVYIYFGNSQNDTKADVIITGIENYGIGYISAAGDVNNDGYDDLMVSSPNQGAGPRMSYVYIHFGGELMDSIPDVTIAKDQFAFGYALSNAGDLNKDGFNDIIVGDEFANATIYLGGSVMDTISDYSIKSESWWHGSSISYLGDINKDGHSDLIIGDPGSNAVGRNMGRAYIYSSTTKNTGIKKVLIEERDLGQIYPNPFKTETTISYILQKTEMVSIVIYNLAGQKIETLVNEIQIPGKHEINWRPDNLPAGIYLCNLKCDESSETTKIVLQK